MLLNYRPFAEKHLLLAKSLNSWEKSYHKMTGNQVIAISITSQMSDMVEWLLKTVWKGLCTRGPTHNSKAAQNLLPSWAPDSLWAPGWVAPVAEEWETGRKRRRGRDAKVVKILARQIRLPALKTGSPQKMAEWYSLSILCLWLPFSRPLSVSLSVPLYLSPPLILVGS